MYKALLINTLFILTLSNCVGNYEKREPILVLGEGQGISVDGEFADWNEISGFNLICDELGLIPSENDLSAELRAAWTKRGLAMYFNIADDVYIMDTIWPWNGDAVEIFLSPKKGSEDILHFSVPIKFSESGKGSVIINDNRRNPELRSIEPGMSVMGKRTGRQTEFELIIKMDGIGREMIQGAEFSLQIYVDDSDKKSDQEKNRLTLFNSNYSGETSFSQIPVRLEKQSGSLPGVFSRLQISDNKELSLRIAGLTNTGILDVIAGDKKIYSEKIFNTGELKSLSFNLPVEGLDLEKDSIYVYLDDECIGFHNLILAPRIYINSKPGRYIQSIRFFRLNDRVNFPLSGGTLFIGSSSIRKWLSLQTDFPELNIINRGFGGSNSSDVLLYMDDIVLPYNPAVIVYYEGDNDISSGMPPDTIIANMKKFIRAVSSKNVKTKFYFISPKPAIIRMNLWNKYAGLHDEMRKMADENNNVYFVDVASEMFDQDGKLKENIFIEDKLHLNELGYDIWTSVLRESMGLKTDPFTGDSTGH